MIAFPEGSRIHLVFHGSRLKCKIGMIMSLKKKVIVEFIELSILPHEPENFSSIEKRKLDLECLRNV